ncbi:MAG: hypothetical protein PHZ09_00030 [Eubacteriales bacterium]|nr:hypothetical protein [Eubacteriales bacterium]
MSNKFRKKGLLDIDIVETTPIVWKGDLWRCEWFRPLHYANTDHVSCGRFVNMETGETSAIFAEGQCFHSAYTENNTLYVYSVNGYDTSDGNNTINLYRSTDMINWKESTALTMPEDWKFYNNSVCLCGDTYYMALEIGQPAAVTGVPFTIVYAVSKNLVDWHMLDTDKYIYTKEFYSACPVIRWSDGYFYIIYLERQPHLKYNFAPFIIRTRDLEHYERCPYPVFEYGDGEADKYIQNRTIFTPEQIEYIESSEDNNNSDVDFCDYNGKTVILYSWGNQLGREFLAEAEYNGPSGEWLASFFK